MKNLMYTISSIFLFILTSIMMLSCTNNSTKKQSATTPQVEQVVTKNQSADVEAYYFHATRRCATCEAVESVTMAALKEYYGTKVSFKSINRDDNKDNPMIAKYKVSGQTLLIIKGDKMVNLTNDAFMNARTNPDKFKAKLKSTIDTML